MSDLIADRYSFSPFGSSPPQNHSPAFCTHTGAEAMFIDPFSPAGLKSPLHGDRSLKVAAYENQIIYEFQAQKASSFSKTKQPERLIIVLAVVQVRIFVSVRNLQSIR